MAGFPSESHPSSKFSREILNDWNPTARRNDKAGGRHQPGGETHSSDRGSSSPEDRESRSGEGPHFSWDMFDRMDSDSGRRTSASDRDQRQARELLEGFALESSQRGSDSTQHPRPRQEQAGAESARFSPPRTGGEHARLTQAAVGLPQPGDEFAGFRILVELGRGAFAHVYLAEEINLGRRPVAIKVSRPDGDEPQILARLQHTHIVPVHSVCDDPKTGLRVLCMPYFGGANLAQVLEASGGLIPTHHNGRSLVEALDQVSRYFTSHSKLLFAGSGSARWKRASQPEPAEPARPALPLMDRRIESFGPSRLRSLFSRWVGPRAVRQTVLPEQQGDHDQPSRQFLHGASAIQAAVWIVARLADGLEHAHSRGLLHRDLKPSNILLAGDGTPMLLDFNLAVESLPQPAETEVRRAFIGGTLPYMSPEHLDAFHSGGATAPEAVDERSDIYALGLILFEMLAGEHPFPEVPPGCSLQGAIELLLASRREVPSLRARCPDIPWSLDALVSKCVAFDPAGRYARARDLAEDLHRFLEHLPMKHGPEPSFRERMGKFAKRHPALCGTTSIALMSILLIALLWVGIVKTFGALQDVYARLMVRQFDRNFTESQFLLYASAGSDRDLKRGLILATKELEQLENDTGSPPLSAGWPRRLTVTERHRLGEQLVELIMLEARARVMVARRHGSERERRREMERAIARLGDAERLSPEVPWALYQERAGYLTALGEADLAAADRRRAADRVPTTCHDLTLAGTTLLTQGDLAAAEEALRRALRQEISSFWAWYVLGHCHYAQKRYLEAAGDFAVCAAREPKFAWVHFNRGLALARAGRLLGARDSYDCALENDREFAEARVNRALVELELNEIDRARIDLTEAIRLGRNDLVVFAALGEAWARLGRREEAERYFASLLERDRGNMVVRVARGMSRVATDPKGAADDFREALDRDERSAQAHYGMALLARPTDLAKALGHLDRALDCNANLVDAVQLRALVRARLGDRGALFDVDRLLESPTANRLYNAACAVAILSVRTGNSQLLSQSFDLLARALEAGFSAEEAAADPDLKPLAASPRFDKLVARFKRSTR
jgi:serine/threonine protein kinase/tetratricopeptide (TPR) repeat protein